MEYVSSRRTPAAEVTWEGGRTARIPVSDGAVDPGRGIWKISFFLRHLTDALEVPGDGLAGRLAAS